MFGNHCKNPGGKESSIRGSPSAPTGRVLDVVELLARSGNRQLRFSDIARELNLTQATAHAILKTLCDRGWASRDPLAKTFALGPALAVVAARTDIARPLTHAARAAALRLSGDFGYAGSVVERFGDSLVVTAFEGEPVTEPSGIPGDRIPYSPPFGVAFAAWDTEEGQCEWIRRGAGNNADRAQRLRDVLARTRERGFDIDWTTPALAQAAQLVGTLDSHEVPAPVRHIMDQLLAEFTTIGFLSDDNPGRRKQPVVTISAPVFDHRQRVALIVAVHPLCTLSAKQIRAIGGRLTEETAAITADTPS
ncbi:helix-turn-helix domain-containing protein [Mycobacterium sp. 1164966.3]|uniref:helix-turn-helix domain-containing protein n=1 Tax=Mycobacterium sp. 1164966.3 TaxID=1856861 RepID=UPI0009ED6DCC|nr:helix-turn-helix domain-containing protein [Mycobacterium sp. 1164966.3]